MKIFQIKSNLYMLTLAAIGIFRIRAVSIILRIKSYLTIQSILVCKDFVSNNIFRQTILYV
ncbi:hypothetical protein NARC_10388 [Candidatus Nitrosocosmicus arcticus]|uniref:Uncharacterized protein n=1 Tax=Candidatus Nitrosocosmicus arcticus TaxID=2035267 RepID=A0A557SZF0_9ARCH|nr:hypothetical protein NARC_10388 [Candidatus Nitrosocosmicus arcticus]